MILEVVVKGDSLIFIGEEKIDEQAKQEK